MQRIPTAIADILCVMQTPIVVAAYVTVLSGIFSLSLLIFVMCHLRRQTLTSILEQADEQLHRNDPNSTDGADGRSTEDQENNI